MVWWSKGKGGGSWKSGGGKGSWKGGGGGVRKRTDKHENEDPPGSVRVLVMGFDFGTTDEMMEAHMGQAGPIHTMHWVSKAKVVIVYKNKKAAAQAAALDNTTIDGNTRYITVKTGS
mmetsp:Transcript_92962/g.161565  ORF Transcript_92962/g.161565 Transcript_92962/m.161565 type:complete len:117 (-) Transcript_92962:58-408(-)